MTRCLSVLLFLFVSGSLFANDWPWWRGPDRNGIADAGQMPPVEFSATKNVRWVVPVPGRGHGSPTVVGPRVFLAIADEYGQFSVFVADPKAFRIVATNQLGDEVLSTPTICGGRIFARVA